MSDNKERNLNEPEVGWKRLVFKLRHGGAGWLSRRIRSELLLPTTAPGKRIHRLLRRGISASLSPFRAIRYRRQHWKATGANTLYAFYDLKVEPVTYDCLWFLVGADLARRAHGLDHVHVTIVPGPVEGLREEDASYEEVVDRESRLWRLYNILIAATSLLPTCRSFTLASSRREIELTYMLAQGHIYPETFEPALPIAHHPNDVLSAARKGVAPIAVLRATPQALKYVDKWISSHADKRKVVVITLRDYAYGAERNSDILSWAAFAKNLDPAIWLPVFVLETERTLEDIPASIHDFRVFREASWNVGIRMALYERAWLNLGVNNGPMGLCWLNDKTRYITFKMVTPAVAQTTVAFNVSRGFVPNKSLPFANQFQKWVWEDDRYEVIEREFNAMEKIIEDSGISPQ